MTGFGQGLAEGERLRVHVTVRTVNHRYFDISMRLREDLRQHERRLRDVFSRFVERGRVEVTLELESLGEASARLVAEKGLVRGVKKLCDELAAQGLELAPPTFADLLRLPGAVRVEAEETSLGEDELQLIVEACELALGQVVAARQLEGGELESVISARLEDLEQVLTAMRQRASEIPAQLASALEQRIAQLIDERVDADRLAQEVAHLADRSDVAEELDRLASHLTHFRQLIHSEGSLGKRLDFLAQEIFRELNTVGSKCRDSELTRAVLDGKVLCEQLREQVQNVE